VKAVIGQPGWTTAVGFAMIGLGATVLLVLYLWLRGLRRKAERERRRWPKGVGRTSRKISDRPISFPRPARLPSIDQEDGG